MAVLNDLSLHFFRCIKYIKLRVTFTQLQMVKYLTIIIIKLFIIPRHGRHALQIPQCYLLGLISSTFRKSKVVGTRKHVQKWLNIIKKNKEFFAGGPFKKGVTINLGLRISHKVALRRHANRQYIMTITYVNKKQGAATP